MASPGEVLGGFSLVPTQVLEGDAVSHGDVAGALARACFANGSHDA